MSQQQVMERVITRAWQDKSFKQELLKNPKAALEKEGIHLPDAVQITVIEETPTSFVLVLPSNPNSRELSESQLESVAGGAAATQGLDWSGGSIIPSWD